VLAGSFIVYRAMSGGPPSGGSVPGLLYGIAGYGLMIFAALLGLRKKVPVWRVGRAQTWMRGHLWLGFLTLPLGLFHCGFTWKGPLAALLIILLFVTVGSGITGAALQHFIPARMTRAVPLETIYEEIPNIRRQLCDEADQLAESIADMETEDAFQIEIESEIRSRFTAMYRNSIRPMLAFGEEKKRESGGEKLENVFDSLRKMLPAGVHPMLADLASICEEERQLRVQKRVYLWLHGWLLVHVPLSLALIVLGAVHAVVSLRY
jgi:hypothetical protein